ncbi:CHAD domain-containing protein, partial [Rhodopseudomonas sp. B29]|uniref:CHAD domain-containing protein n=1 Tax=Rhodopseudomonas sp. B29 TaxID=95607 RepID=UPI0003B79A04
VQQPAVRHADPTGVHQMRIALRRMRAAISIFGPMVDGRESRRLRGELKWLAGRLAPARDLHLLELKFTSAQLGGASPAFLKRLGNDRATAFTRAKATVEQPRFRSLLRDLRHWIDGDDWSKAAGPDAERPAKGFARHVLAHRARKLVKRLDRLDELDDHSRHQVRIRAKKLYYAAGFFESLFDSHSSGKQLARFKKQLKKLLDSLGALNDISVHRELTSKFAGRAKAKLDHEAAAQLSDLDAAEIRRQMKAALKAAGKLADRPLFGD